MRGVIVIGEGEKDEAPMLYNGEEVGNGLGPEWDVAVDPVDGTTLMAKGMPNAVAVIALAERGTMFNPKDVFYMDKIAVGPDAVDAIDIDRPASNVRNVARAKNPYDITVCILDRPSHAEFVRRFARPAPGSSSSPTATSPARSWPPAPISVIDLMMGVGGTPEGVITACAMRASAGPSRRSCHPPMTRKQKAIDAGHDLDRVLSPRTWSEGERVLRRHRDHRRGAAARRALQHGGAPPNRS